MNKENEYQALREEILHASQNAKNYRSLLFTVVAALLAFAVDNGDPILFLIPFAVIIPLYFAEISQIDIMIKIGAYIYVFIEPNTECLWENRLFKQDTLNIRKKNRSFSVNCYGVISICCIILSVLNLDIDTQSLHFYAIIFFQVIIFTICIYIYIFHRANYYERKKKYIKDWESVKKLEECDEI